MSIRNNKNFKRIRLALELTKHDIFDILGEKYSKSQIDGWSRGANARKLASGNSPAETVSRFRAMTDQQFDDFCEGLVDWMKSTDEDS
ncbi:DUF1456 family protein [Xenorhabdus ehlersii]|uniref:Uncharacterized protein DUF1456 n=1 Tax=Xenorhabdus ehlersii TaxID=290111 RepID=A0A2D0IMG7_9GAMM|nr:DUF1456 family protein [Xenorhabdus ehlersii]PHM23006.1 hypothetical protein Xehl_03240 [Xenorhabdus ehlersii]RKE92673.1 uncharacterized protein DUF1456 [Xenorhabdus ehlersii]